MLHIYGIEEASEDIVKEMVDNSSFYSNYKKLNYIINNSDYDGPFYGYSLTETIPELAKILSGENEFNLRNLFGRSHGSTTIKASISYEPLGRLTLAYMMDNTNPRLPQLFINRRLDDNEIDQFEKELISKRLEFISKVISGRER